LPVLSKQQDICSHTDSERKPDTIVRAIRSLNMNNMTKVKAGDTYTEEIPIPGGIRQWFNLLMDRIIKEVSSLNMGYRMEQNTRISMVCYADDTAIFARNEDNLQRLHKFCHIYRKNEKNNLC